MSTSCPDCDMEFSRKDVMLRHKRNKHGISQAYPPSSQAYPPSSQAYPPPPPPPPPLPPPPPPPPKSIILQHPFTMILAGPTGSGKTYWMKQLLESARTMIRPPAERIIWCYKRWQPLFDEMKRTVKSMLFVQGLPDNLNDDSFIDTRYRTLIILDDLMRDATNSKDVCELFVEGSHHRNISVACIVQNAFSKGKENRTMSINSQYIVLFKNPRDQIGPAVFARQMYPNNPKKFMNKYTEATRKPYGYLFIDLKQNTPDEERLKTDIFGNIPGSTSSNHSVMTGSGIETYISGDVSKDNQSEDRRQREQTYLLDTESKSTDNIEHTMHSCDDCGLLFESVHDLARHMNQWCPENGLKRKRDDAEDDTPSKRLHTEIEIEDDEDTAFTKLAKLARKANKEIWEAKVNKYIDNGLGQADAERKADRKLKDEDMDQLMSKYGSLIQYILQIRTGKLHAKVMKMVDDLLEDGIDYHKAIKMTVRKYRHLLENYLDEINEDAEDDSEDEDEEVDESEEEEDDEPEEEEDDE